MGIFVDILMDSMYITLFAQIYLSILNSMLNVDSHRRHTKNNYNLFIDAYHLQT